MINKRAKNFCWEKSDVFKGKKIFIIGSAPDPKIDYEYVKDHVWVTMKGSGWAIKNIWGIDRIPDYCYLPGHQEHRFSPEMYQQIEAKTIIFLVPDEELWCYDVPDWYIKDDFENPRNKEEYYRSKGVKFDNYVSIPIIDTAAGFRKLVESNFFTHARQYYTINTSIGAGLIAHLCYCGAEEIVISGMSIEKKREHSYSGRGLSNGQLVGLHKGQDFLTFVTLRKIGCNLKTFEPELNRRTGIPLVGNGVTAGS
jgi:hypothetical protein